MPKIKKKRKKKSPIKKKIKKVKRFKKIKLEQKEEKELIYKTKKDWVSKALVNKSQYEKNIKHPYLTMMVFGKKKEKGLLGSSRILKSKMLNTVNQMLGLNGFMMVR